MAKGIMTVEGDLLATELRHQDEGQIMATFNIERSIPVFCNACEEALEAGKQKTTCTACGNTFHMNCIADHECVADSEKVDPGVDSTAPAEAPQDVTAPENDKANTPAEAATPAN